MGRLLKETPLSEIVATMEVLDRYGVNRDDLTCIRSNYQFAKDLAHFIRYGKQGTKSVHDRACSIMGKNFFGVEEAIKRFGVNPTSQQLVALSEIPFSETVLEQSKDTHVLVAVFPLSILEIRGKRGDTKLFYDKSSWYKKETFAKKRDEASWYLVCKTPAENSFLKTWQEQQAFLAKDDEVPSARVMTYVIIGHYLATGERLFKSVYVRTSSLDFYGYHVLLGLFDEDGLSFNQCCEYNRSDDIGLASARKFPEL
ncbi:MAG: hypothetical protein Q8N59_01645 [bacterium]|nr:hypothetical protein [bacterium]